MIRSVANKLFLAALIIECAGAVLWHWTDHLTASNIFAPHSLATMPLYTIALGALLQCIAGYQAKRLGHIAAWSAACALGLTLVFHAWLVAFPLFFIYNYLLAAAAFGIRRWRPWIEV